MKSTKIAEKQEIAPHSIKILFRSEDERRRFLDATKKSGIVQGVFVRNAVVEKLERETREQSA